MDRMSSAKMPHAWGQAHELRSWAESIDAKTFTALSPGLGLGELKPTSTLTAPARPATSVTLPQVTARGLVDKAERALPTRPSKSPDLKPRLAFERKCIAWAVDFLFVTSSLGLAVAVATAVAAMRADAGTSLLDLSPVTWLAAFAPYQILIGVYAVFLVYGIAFRFSLGRTFGESVVVPRGQAQSGWRS